MGLRHQGDIGRRQGRAHADDLGVRFGVHQAGKAIARVAPDADAAMAVLLVEEDTGWGRGGVIASLLQVVVQFLDTRLMRDRWEQIGRTGRRLGGVGVAPSMDLIEMFGLGIVGLQVVIGDRPGRRNPVVVVEFSKILLAQAK